MLQTVEAEVDVNGEIRLLEPLSVKKKSRAIVILLENGNASPLPKGNSQKMLEFLQTHRLSNEPRSSAAEIEAIVEENRNSWD